MTDDNSKYVMMKLSERSPIIIGRLLGETITDVVLHHPIIMTMVHAEDHTMEIIASKYFPFSEENVVSMSKMAIVAYTSPSQQLIQFYVDFMEKYKGPISAKIEQEVLEMASEQNLGSKSGAEVETPVASVVVVTGTVH